MFPRVNLLEALAHVCTMDVTRMRAVIALSLVTIAGSFAIPSSFKTGHSCFEGCFPSTSGRSGVRVEPHLAGCRREEQQKQQRHQRRQRSPPLLFSSSHSPHVADQQRRHRSAGLGCSSAATATARRARRTATNMCTSSHSNSGSSSSSRSSSREDEEEFSPPKPRSIRQENRKQGRGQQTRADFLRTGASVAGFAAVVLGVQQQV